MLSTSPGTTHRQAPFVGRTREMGILSELLRDGLEGSLHLVRVAGATGAGRRRLIGEALHRGPDAEWISLAPGGVELDLQRWVGSELVDLIESYPDLSYPSWSMHALATLHPRLQRFAAVPALSRERLPRGRQPEVLGAAVAAVARTLTAGTSVVVDVGIWPREGTPRERFLRSLVDRLRIPAVVAVGAVEVGMPPREDEPGVRTLLIDNLPLEEVHSLVEAWGIERESLRLTHWLARISGGQAFYIQELVRWLEELGHLRIDEEAGRAELLGEVSRLPLPFHLEAVMGNRYHRLPPGAAHLLWMICRHDGRLALEQVRERYEAEADGFEEALTLLRRRDFLLHRHFRQPLAAASPLWREIALRSSKRKLGRRRRRRRPAPEPIAPPRRSASALAGVMDRLARIHETLRGPGTTADPAPELAAVLRMAGRRTGPAWEGAWGRACVLAAWYRLQQGAGGRVLDWCRWGRRRLRADTHPALRRSLGRLEVMVLEAEERAPEAAHRRGELLEEALLAGHLVTAAGLRAAQAEALRRLGRLRAALDESRRAEDDLMDMGLASVAELAWYTRVRALLGARHLDAAREEMGRQEQARRWHSPFGPLELTLRVKAFEQTPPIAGYLELHHTLAPPQGWGWGLDENELFVHARSALARAAGAVREDRPAEALRQLRDLEPRLRQGGYLPDLADLHEMRLRILVSGDGDGAPDREAVAAELKQLAGLHVRLGMTSRLEYFARTWHDTPASAAEPWHLVYQPHLLRPAGIRVEGTPLTTRHLHLLGRPRVEVDGRGWPLPLWPEWWLFLLGGVVSRTLLGHPVGEEDLRRFLGRSGDAPRGSLESLLLTADSWLWGNQAAPGGFQFLSTGTPWSWIGLRCDVAEVLDDLEKARAAEEARDAGRAEDLRHAALNRVAGTLLPSLEEVEVGALRRRLRGAILHAVDALLEQGPPPTGDRFVQWLEGPGLAAPLSDALARDQRRRGRPRGARALRRGSPSGSV